MAGGTRSYEMARRLVESGHEVHMITSWRGEGNGEGWFTTVEDGIVVHWLRVKYSQDMGFSQRIKAFFKFAFSASEKAKSITADVVFATSTPLTIAIPAIKTIKRKKVPMVFEVRDLWPEMPIAIGALKNPLLKYAARALEKWAYRHSEAIVALSPGMRDGVVATGYPAGKVSVIPNSCDNGLFKTSSELATCFRSERSWLQDKPLLVYVGSIGVVNGVGFLVRLAKALSEINSDIQILVVGDGAERALIENLAADLGVLNKNFFIESNKPKKDIPAVLAAATVSCGVFVDLPEMRANSSNKFFDSLAAGKPLLLNYGGWQHDLLLQHNFGISAWQKDIVSVAKEVEQKIQDSDWVIEAGKNARLLAENVFDRDVLAKQLQDVLVLAAKSQGDKTATVAPGTYN